MFLCKTIAASDPQVLAIKKFMYQCYAVDLHWVPNQGNPSQWVVMDSQSPAPCFADFYDSHAQWFAVYEQKGHELIGSCRLISPKEQKLEIELYHEIPSKYKRAKMRLEMNRLSVKREYLSSNVTLMLFMAALEYSLQQNIDAFFIAAPPGIADICTKMGLTRVENGTFKYFSSDPQSSTILHLDLTNKTLIEGILRQCRNMS